MPSGGLDESADVGYSLLGFSTYPCGVRIPRTIHIEDFELGSIIRGANHVRGAK